MQPLLRVALVLTFLGSWMVRGGFAEEDTAPPPDEDVAAIKAAIKSYADAFNARDAQKLAAHWAPEGVYTSRSTGDQVIGRAALTEEFTSLFGQDSVPQLEVATDSIEFISPNVALERGRATVKHADDDASLTNYRVVYVKQQGQWLIDRVTEDAIDMRASNYEELQDLEWIIGSWLDETEGLSIKIECDWTANQNYIYRKFSVTRDDQVESSGLQIIGWDPKAKQIRSWLFDSDGGFVSGTWTQRDGQWMVPSIATLADGGSGSFTSIFRPVDENSYAWRKINRIVDGELLPNMDEIIIARN